MEEARSMIAPDLSCGWHDAAQTPAGEAGVADECTSKPPQHQGHPAGGQLALADVIALSIQQDDTGAAQWSLSVSSCGPASPVRKGAACWTADGRKRKNGCDSDPLPEAGRISCKRRRSAPPALTATCPGTPDQVRGELSGWARSVSCRLPLPAARSAVHTSPHTTPPFLHRTQDPASDEDGGDTASLTSAKDERAAAAAAAPSSAHRFRARRPLQLDLDAIDAAAAAGPAAPPSAAASSASCATEWIDRMEAELSSRGGRAAGLGGGAGAAAAQHLPVPPAFVCLGLLSGGCL
jgi:hypothetical protein